MVGGGAKAAPGPSRPGRPAGCATALKSIPSALLIASANCSLHLEDPHGIRIGRERVRRLARCGQPRAGGRNRRRIVHPERLDAGVHLALDRFEERRRWPAPDAGGRTGP
jgi:hypothetical protein